MSSFPNTNFEILFKCPIPLAKTVMLQIKFNIVWLKQGKNWRVERICWIFSSRNYEKVE